MDLLGRLKQLLGGAGQTAKGMQSNQAQQIGRSMGGNPRMQPGAVGMQSNIDRMRPMLQQRQPLPYMQPQQQMQQQPQYEDGSPLFEVQPNVNPMFRGGYNPQQDYRNKLRVR